MLLRDMIGYLFYIPVYELLREALSERTTMNEHICVVKFYLSFLGKIQFFLEVLKITVIVRN